ncbi:MAG: DUF6279 family lipoprotein [Hydrogenophaga sp.]|jgi:hypothetical protein|nr:DUF6279 family lipoprotein [Hydrogenophaga sp.]
MSTFLGETARRIRPGAFVAQIIALRWWRWAAALVLVSSVAACGAARLAYNQAPNLTYWWLDDYVDFTSEQTPVVRDKINAFFDWHRNEELPAYSRRLEAWQALATRDISAAEACTEYDAVRERIDRATERMVPDLARMALQLGPGQLDAIQQRQAKRNEEFSQDHLQPTREKELDDRLKKAVDRSERLYGTLTTEQRQLLRAQLQRSPWDPQRTHAERLRRQADLLQTLQDIKARPEQAESLVRGHIERIARSPTPGYADYSRSLVQHGCAQFAALHNSTSEAQRAQAVSALKGYTDDVIRLAGRR